MSLPLAEKHGPAAESPLDALRFAVVDVETTGTRADGGDRITEIAVVLVDGLQLGAGYAQLIDPQRPIPPFVASLTGITDQMVRGQPTFGSVAQAVRTQLAGRVFVAHNVSFDWRFVRGECARAGVLLPETAQLCTVRMARRLLPFLPRRSLDQVAAHFGIANDARHRAFGDARATAIALVHLLQLAQRQGARSWLDLHELLSPARRSGRLPGRLV